MKHFLVICLNLLLAPALIGYGLPSVNLGLSNFLDGGPLRPVPGWYWTEYLSYYHADKFLNAQGKPLGGVPSPHFNEVTPITQFTYLSKRRLFKGWVGGSVVLPATAYSHINCNRLQITDIGSGIGDLNLGIFLQWKARMRGERPIFVHRIEFNATFPTGKNKTPCAAINPGNNTYHIDPYWAATLFFTPHFAASWRLHYLWVSKNKKTGLKAGDAVHMNFDIEYNVYKKFWVGINGYFLQQIKNNKLFGVSVPDSRERVVGIGPGAFCFLPKKFIFLTNLYFETDVRNRPQGISFVARVIKQF